MTALALELCCTLMADRRSSANVGLTVRSKVLPQALTLVRSSLLQGQALLVLPCFCWFQFWSRLFFIQHSLLLICQALQNFFAALVYSANTSFETLLDSLLSTAKPSSQSGGVTKQALFSIAQCVAVLCLAAGDQKCSSTVNMLTDSLKDDSSTNSVGLLFIHLFIYLFIFVSWIRVCCCWIVCQSHLKTLVVRVVNLYDYLIMFSTR